MIIQVERIEKREEGVAIVLNQIFKTERWKTKLGLCSQRSFELIQEEFFILAGRKQ